MLTMHNSHHVIRKPSEKRPATQLSHPVPNLLVSRPAPQGRHSLFSEFGNSPSSDEHSVQLVTPTPPRLTERLPHSWHMCKLMFKNSPRPQSGVGDGVGRLLGTGVDVGSEVVGSGVGDGVGNSDGAGEAVGAEVVGCSVGAGLGSVVGNGVGTADGA